MSVSTFTIVVVITYLIIVKVIGYFAHRLGTQTADDYFITARTTGTLALLATLLATGINGLTVTGTPAMVYEGGILFGQMFIIVGIALFLRWYYASRIWTAAQQNNFMTQAELFSHHYKSPTILVLTIIASICSVFPFLIIQFAAVAKIFSVITNNVITYELSILLLAFSTGFYIFFGGARAVIWTDIFQGFIFLVIFFVTAYLFTIWAGGFSQSIETLTQVMPEKLTFNSQNTPIFFDRVISWTIAFFLFPHIFQRLMMGKSPKVVRKATFGSMIIAIFILATLLTMGIMATATLYGEISDRDQLLAEMYHRHWPMGGTLLVLAVFACGMSTIDSVLLTLSSIFTRDIADKLFSKPLPEKTEYTLARIISLVTLVTVALLAMSNFGKGYLAPLATFGATFAMFLLWPFIGMFSWKGATKIGVISAMGVGFFGVFVLNLADNFWSFELPFGNATLIFFASLGTFIVVSLLTQLQNQKV